MTLWLMSQTQFNPFNWKLTSRAFKQMPISGRLNGVQLSAVQKSQTWSRPQRVSEVSLTVLQGQRSTVHRLAFGWTSALSVGLRVGAVDAAAKAGAQLQAPHVADHSCRIKGLLWRKDERMYKDKYNTKDATLYGFTIQQDTEYYVFTTTDVLFEIAYLLTLHLLLAKFFRICRLTDSCMFLQRAVSPAILKMKVLLDHVNNISHIQTQLYPTGLYLYV